MILDIDRVFSVVSSRRLDRESPPARRTTVSGNALTPRQLKLKVGYRDLQWVKNCVAVGLSAAETAASVRSSTMAMEETARWQRQ